MARVDDGEPVRASVTEPTAGISDSDVWHDANTLPDERFVSAARQRAELIYEQSGCRDAMDSLLADLVRAYLSYVECEAKLDVAERAAVKHMERAAALADRVEVAENRPVTVTADEYNTLLVERAKAEARAVAAEERAAELEKVAVAAREVYERREWTGHEAKYLAASMASLHTALAALVSSASPDTEAPGAAQTRRRSDRRRPLC